MKKFLLLFLLMLAINPAHADEDEPQAPDPLRLSSDWWTYFEPVIPISTETLNKRVDEAISKLDTLRSQYKDETTIAVAPLVTQLKQEIESFRKLKSAAPPVEKPLPTLQNEYTLTQAVQAFAQRHSLKQQYDTSKEEYEWRNAVIVADRKQQSRRRNQYLESDKTDPNRLMMGLELMVSRFGLELKRLELDRQKSILQGLEKQLAWRATELDAIPNRLSVPQEEKALWRKAYDDAQTTIDRLQKQSDQIRTDTFIAHNTPQELMQSRYTVLLDIKRNVDTALWQYKASQANLALALIKLLTEKTGTDTAETRAVLSAYDNLESTVEQNLNGWRKATERVERNTSDLALDKSNPDPKLLNLHKSVLNLAKSTGQLLRELSQQQTITGYMAGLLRNRLQLTEGWFQRGVKDTSHATKQAWQVATNLLGETLFEINETPVTILGLVRIVLILAIAWWLSKGIRKALRRIGERRAGVNKSSLYTLGRIIHYIVLILGVIIGLSSIGIDFTKFALFASALGVGVGFGLQTLISNFVAGLIILFERSLKVGDFVELESGVTGIVNEINIRSTLITTNDNIDILVPNSEFVGGRVTNWTLREAYRRIHVPFGVAYGTDKDKVKKAVLEAADKVKWTLKGKPARSPQVWFVEFGDSSLNFELVVWLTPEAVKRPGAVNAAYLWEIETELTNNGIEIPFPQRDLHLRSVFGHKDENGLAVLQDTVNSQGKAPS